MSDHPCQITLPFADGDKPFRLTVPAMEEWEKKFDRSLFGTMLAWFRSREARPSEVREIIRLGLIGGGMAPHEALRLVRDYVDERPSADSFPLAFEIVEARMYGNPEHQAAKRAAVKGAEVGQPAA